MKVGDGKNIKSTNRLMLTIQGYNVKIKEESIQKYLQLKTMKFIKKYMK